METAADSLFLADRQRLRGRIRQFEQRRHNGLPLDQLAHAIEQELDRAERRWKHRQAWQPSLGFPAELPVSAQRDRILEAFQRHPVIIVCGDTGSGKTTQLPKIALLAGRGRRGCIGCTQPRRLAAVSMARRVAEEMQADLGRQVGYQVRFDNRSGEETAVKFMTDGILLAETLTDRRLWRYDALIIDEAHERNLNIDFILGYLKTLLPQRPDLKVIISSATLDPQAFSEFFGGAPVIEVAGRTYPIEDVFLPPLDPDEDAVRQVARAVRWVDELDTAGDLLVFLPGEREIREAADLLKGKQYPNTEILPLFARLSLAEQQRVFTIGGRRRIVLATNVAETSITIPGIRYVVDSGLVRLNRYRPRRQIQSLQIEPVSQASARQRRGRCGRVADGVCVHLYSEETLAESPPFTDPEIRRASLAGVILQMETLRLPPIDEFPLIQPPSRALIEEGYGTLFEIGALDDQKRLTPRGRELGQFPVDPRIGRMILRAREEGALSEMLVLAAALSIQDPRERPFDRLPQADAAHEPWRDERSDFFGYLRLWNAWQTQRRTVKTTNRLRRWCKAGFLSFRRMLEWQNLFRELADVVGDLGWNARVRETVKDDCFYDRVHRSILAGIPLQIGTRSGSMEYQGAHGRNFFIFPGSALFASAPRWVVAFSLVETVRLYARVVGAIQPEWVEQVAPHLCSRTHHDVAWDAEQGFVYARETVRCGDLTLLDDRRVHYGRIDPVAAREIFIRDGLAPGHLRSRSDWLARHRRLLEQITALEQKLRRPHGLLHEMAISDHFHRLVPPEVCSTRALDQWLQEQRPPLDLTIEQAMIPQSEPVAAADYPDETFLRGCRFPLRYRYAPGEPDDGITLSCPESLLKSLPPGATDWLVLGCLPEKVRALIRSLPKPIWTACQPLDRTVADFLGTAARERAIGEQPLTDVLARFLGQRLNARVRPADFDPSRLPEYLVMKLAVLDRTGQVLCIVRSRPADAAVSSELPDQSSWLPREWIRRGMTGWDGPALPDHVVLPAGVPLKVSGYPALVDEGESVGLRIFLEESEARARHRAGVKRLFRRQQHDLVARLEKDLPVPMPVQLALLAMPGENRTALEDFIELLIDEVIRGGQPEYPRDPAILQRRVQSARADLFERAGELGRSLGRILEQRDAAIRAVQQARGKFAASPAPADLERQLAFLFRAGFLRDAEGWREYPRYLQAISVRLERLALDPAKDRAKWEAVRPFQQLLDARFAQPSDRPPSAALQRFARLLQEFRVAQFAPELGTAEKVSPQRLQAAWEAAGPGLE